MPWEKSFDEQEVVDKAMQVFWKKGYEATSIADLIKSTGINRGSLYNAFGGKKQLFMQSLIKYDTDTRRATLAKLERIDNPTLAFKTLFDILAQQELNDPKKRGCFLVNTAIELHSHDELTQDLLRQGAAEFESFFRRGIEVAQMRNEMPVKLDPASTAKVLYSLVVAMRVLGRGLYDEVALQAISEQAQCLTAFPSEK